MNSRRKFLVGLGAVGTVGGIAALGLTGTISSTFSGITASLFNRDQQSLIVSCGSDSKGHYFAIAVDMQGRIISKISLPARGHDVIAINSKPGHALVFARRPGEYILEVDFTRGEVINKIMTDPSQRFYGHGVLINNDQILVTTENDYENSKGLIVLRDRISQKVIEQYDSGGIGPHQLKVMPNSNQQQIVIANGGILTHPAQSRKKLNLDTMRPNLAYMSLASGQIDDSFELENKHLSIRHLDVSAQGKVIAGLQYQGASTDDVPLAISHQGETRLNLLKADTATWRSMKHYTASVCVNSDNNTAAITCPKGNVLTFWDLNTDEFIGSHKLKDGAGITYLKDSLIASTGRGKLISQKNPREAYQVTHNFKGLRWDNHMTTIS